MLCNIFSLRWNNICCSCFAPYWLSPSATNNVIWGNNTRQCRSICSLCFVLWADSVASISDFNPNSFWTIYLINSYHFSIGNNIEHAKIVDVKSKWLQDPPATWFLQDPHSDRPSALPSHSICCRLPLSSTSEWAHIPHHRRSPGNPTSANVSWW